MASLFLLILGIFSPFIALAGNCGCDLSGAQASSSSSPSDLLNPNQIGPESILAKPVKPALVLVKPQVPGVTREISVDERLRGCEVLRKKIYWQDAGGRQIPYDQWGEPSKGRLDEVFQALLRGDRDLGLQCPDPARALHSNKRTYLSAAEAFDVYIAHVAHVLYLEATAKVPWRIGCRGVGELNHLLVSDRYHSIIADSDQIDYPSHIQPGSDFQTPFYAKNAPILSCDPREGYRFMTGALSHQTENLLGVDEEDTLANLSLFFRDHWVHDETLGATNGSPQLEQHVLLSDRLKPTGITKRSAYLGCHGAAGTFYELARSVNIPLINAGFLVGQSKTGHFSNRAHRGLIYGAYSPDIRILWHIDNLYANFPGPVFPVNSAGVALNESDAKRRYFDRHWPTAEQLVSWGFVETLVRVVPGIGFGDPDAGQYEDYPQFGYLGGYWQISDRAEQLFNKPPTTQAEWQVYNSYAGDIEKKWALENYYQLGSRDLVYHACNGSDGQLALYSLIDNYLEGSRTGLVVPVTRSKPDYWQHAQSAVTAHGGCAAVDAVYRQWEQGRN